MLFRHEREQCNNMRQTRTWTCFMLLLALCGLVGCEHGGLHDLETSIEKSRKQLATADQLWHSDNKAEAIQAYKRFLNSETYYQFHGELPRVFRRVIEYEADYGDPGEARDWIYKAWEEWPGRRMKLSFESKKATQLWDEVVSKLNNEG